MNHATKGEGIMASNFSVNLHMNHNKALLKLKGDFDGTSAFQLIEYLKYLDESFEKVVLLTYDLKTVFSFGLNVLHSDPLFRCMVKQSKIEFLGRDLTPSRLAPVEFEYYRSATSFHTLPCL